MDYILSIVVLAGINMIAVLGLSIFTGFTGLFSLGHAAFVGVGAYTSAILTYYYYVPFPLALLSGAAAAGLVSLIIGIPTLRAKLRSDYFAIAILGFGEALRVILENLEITNGARGLPGIDSFTTLPIVIFCLGGGILVARNFLRSREAHSSEDPIAAEMAGVRLFQTRLLSLVVSAVYCGLSGGLLAHFLSFIQPVMLPDQSAASRGGHRRRRGCCHLIASFVFIALPEALRVAQIWRLVAYGLLLVLIMVYRPQGLMGYSEISSFFSKNRSRERMQP
ncbi:branched-chain amino acid ABC transporter permease [Aminivibrio sp.]